jgi:hypothetical protein
MTIKNEEYRGSLREFKWNEIVVGPNIKVDKDES